MRCCPAIMLSYFHLFITVLPHHLRLLPTPSRLRFLPCIVTPTSSFYLARVCQPGFSVRPGNHSQRTTRCIRNVPIGLRHVPCLTRPSCPEGCTYFRATSCSRDASCRTGAARKLYHFHGWATQSSYERRFARTTPDSGQRMKSLGNVCAASKLSM